MFNGWPVILQQQWLPAKMSSTFLCRPKKETKNKQDVSSTQLTLKVQPTSLKWQSISTFRALLQVLLDLEQERATFSILFLLCRVSMSFQYFCWIFSPISQLVEHSKLAFALRGMSQQPQALPPRLERLERSTFCAFDKKYYAKPFQLTTSVARTALPYGSTGAAAQCWPRGEPGGIFSTPPSFIVCR